VATLQVHAYGFATTFRLRELVPLFAEGAVQEVAVKERLLARYGEKSWALAYDFGAVVFVGVSPEETERRVRALEGKLPAEPHPPLTETFLIEEGERAVAPEVRFDRVLVAPVTQEVVDIVALVIAQSVAMDYYAKDVERIEEETDRITQVLSKAGRIPGRLKQLVRFIGLCIATRNDVISTLALFDKPEATWENESLDRLWEGLYRMLELDDRYKALEAKLRMFQDNLVVLVDLARQRQTLRLEMTVAVLILLEIMIMVWQVLKATGHAG
jgi:uncharacterized Rmd1/YagE family protein